MIWSHLVFFQMDKAKENSVGIDGKGCKRNGLEVKREREREERPRWGERERGDATMPGARKGVTEL